VGSGYFSHSGSTHEKGREFGLRSAFFIASWRAGGQLMQPLGINSWVIGPEQPAGRVIARNPETYLAATPRLQSSWLFAAKWGRRRDDARRRL